MLNTDNYQGSANQKHFALVRIVMVKKTRIISVDKELEKGKPCALLVGM